MRKKYLLSSVIILTEVVLWTTTGQQAFKGWPGHDDISDLKACWKCPPKGYGNVPFYWWSGDSLDIDRLRWQLEKLSTASTDGLCVSYHHTHDKVDSVLNAAGHGPCGRVCGGAPRVMSEKWWKIWNDFSADCAARGIGLGMDDYVIAWPHNGEFIDSILARPEIAAYQGLLIKEKDGGIRTESAPWLHPDLGRLIVENYFQVFADHMDSTALKGMNYFFQDELQYGLNMHSWCEDMPQEFMRRKGYDIREHLDALFVEKAEEVTEDIARVRLDYAEVLTCLAEERYFKPIFDWNASRGLIYGCDPEGRGKRPLQYLDYFRAVSWFTAPGNDAPSRGSSFLQTKVSSSIAHLYNRPRTWLEAFHSIGWDASGATLKRQLDHHLIAGGNLLCMHGLYYSTHGGWWEWAPPCFHFRMPYWPHMKLWLRYAERMCFLLSQGRHVCDVAILYPTETMQAFPGSDAKFTFAVADSLSRHGIDYDFIDYQSLQKATVDGTNLMAECGECYRILVLAGTKAMHSRTREKVEQFRQNGGIVLEPLSANDIADMVYKAIIPDFQPNTSAGAKGGGRVLHRRIGKRDVYMVMDAAQGDTMFFRCLGNVEKWDAGSGSCSPVEVAFADRYGTSLVCDTPEGNACVYVFSPDGETYAQKSAKASEGHIQAIDGEWDMEIVPTMDNRWGDFRLPSSDELIGVEARQMRYGPYDIPLTADAPFNTYGYGPYMEHCCPEDGMHWQPYAWSWQYGVQDSPGNQGWHGLKSRVDSRFIILNSGKRELFRTNVYAPYSGSYKIIKEGVAPQVLTVDSRVVNGCGIVLKKGWHKLMLDYAPTAVKSYSLEKMRGGGLDRRERSMVVFYPSDAPLPEEYGMFDNIVAAKLYGTNHLEYDLNPKGMCWQYRFESAPGTVQMQFEVFGTVKAVTIDGKKVKFCAIASNSGRTAVSVDVPSPNPHVSNICIIGTPFAGFPGPAFFASPVKIRCQGGKSQPCNWADLGALKYYSGGVRYGKDFHFDPKGCSHVTLDLGTVSSTCEVSVNGSQPIVLINSPFQCEIGHLLHSGDNRIEVLVYSSLGGHYSTVPSAYRGRSYAGMIGPVKLVMR